MRGGEFVETGVSVRAAGKRRHGPDRGIDETGERASGSWVRQVLLSAQS